MRPVLHMVGVDKVPVGAAGEATAAVAFDQRAPKRARNGARLAPNIERVSLSILPMWNEARIAAQPLDQRVGDARAITKVRSTLRHGVWPGIAQLNMHLIAIGRTARRIGRLGAQGSTGNLAQCSAAVQRRCPVPGALRPAPAHPVRVLADHGIPGGRAHPSGRQIQIAARLPRQCTFGRFRGSVGLPILPKDAFCLSGSGVVSNVEQRVFVGGCGHPSKCANFRVADAPLSETVAHCRQARQRTRHPHFLTTRRQADAALVVQPVGGGKKTESRCALLRIELANQFEQLSVRPVDARIERDNALGEVFAGLRFPVLAGFSYAF